MWVLFWRPFPDILYLIACSWLGCYGNECGRSSLGAIPHRVWCGDENVGDQLTAVRATLALNFWYPLCEQAADLGEQTRCLPTVLFIILTGNLGQARRVAQHPHYLLWIFFFFIQIVLRFWRKEGKQIHFGAYVQGKVVKNQLIMRIISTSSRCSKVPGVRIQPARSSCRRGEFGRSRVEHKERIKAEDTSFNHAPPVLTEDWGGRGVAELGFCFWLLFRGQTLTTTRSWTIERSFQSVLMTLYIWGAVRALTYVHSWLVTAIIRRVFFCYCSVLSTAWGSLNWSPL